MLAGSYIAPQMLRNSNVNLPANVPDLIRPHLDTLPREPGNLVWNGHGPDRDRSRDLHTPANPPADKSLDPVEAAARLQERLLNDSDDEDGVYSRDLPLSFRWAGPTDWTATLDLPPLRPKNQQASASILLEAVLARCWKYPAVSYSRRPVFYTNKQGITARPSPSPPCSRPSNNSKVLGFWNAGPLRAPAPAGCSPPSGRPLSCCKRSRRHC